MSTKTALDQELLALAAAYLRGQGKRQKDIAKNLKISQPEVSRLLKHALKKKWLAYPAPLFTCPDDKKELWQRSRERFFSSEKLLTKLQAHEPKDTPRLRKIAIYHGGPDGQFDRTVLPAMSAVLDRVRVLGVTWGRTICNLLNVLREHLPGPVRTDDPIRVVPLCGEPLKDLESRLEHSSSALAVALNEILNGATEKPPPSLHGIPAFIPFSFNEEEAETIRRFIRQFTGYGVVFGGNRTGRKRTDAPHLADEVDAVLTSVGVVVNPKGRGIFLKERIKLGEITEAQMTETVIGDLGGILIPQRHVTNGQRKRIDDMNARWTGIKLDGLRRCGARAADGARPGVVVVATDKHRADMVLRCIELGLINQLVVSRELADELELRAAAGV
jgi:DNA-binding transcriptional regulator LsrR (DeoR family)